MQMDIKLQGVRNIRDFSEYGFPGHIRSAHLHDMTEGDAEVLSKQYHLKTVIDLLVTDEFSTARIKKLWRLCYIVYNAFRTSRRKSSAVCS